MEIRRAVPDDAWRVTDVNLASWETAYRGLIDDSALDTIKRVRTTDEWRSYIRAPDDPEQRLWVVEANARTHRFHEKQGWRAEPGPEKPWFGAPRVGYRLDL